MCSSGPRASSEDRATAKTRCPLIARKQGRACVPAATGGRRGGGVRTAPWQGAGRSLRGRWLVISFALMAARRGQGIPVIPPLSAHLLLASCS